MPLLEVPHGANSCFVNNIICYDIICSCVFLVLHSEICQLYLEAFKKCSYISVKYKEAVLSVFQLFEEHISDKIK